MKAFIIFLLMAGIFLVVHGVYSERLERAQKKVKVEYRFVPRTLYDEFLFEKQFTSKFDNIFNEESRWFNNTVGLDNNIRREHKTGPVKITGGGAVQGPI